MTSIFGKLTPYNTLIHRLDPRLKFLALIVLMVLCFLPYGNYANRFIILGTLSIIVFTVMGISRISFFEFLKSLKSLLVMMLFLMIIFVFVGQNTNVESLHPLFVFSNGYTIYWEGLFQTLHVFIRLLLMIALTMILTSTTETMDITYALDWYLSPLKIFHFPTQILTMILSLALRFIPTLLDESHKIMKAQRSRGVDFNRGFLVSKIKSITTLIIPLLVSCFSRSSDLSLAMEARGYDPYDKRNYYKKLSFNKRDFFALIFILIIMGLFITVSVYTSNVSGFDDLLFKFFGIKSF